VLGHKFAEYRPADVSGEEFARLVGSVVGFKIDTAALGLKVDYVAEPRIRKRDDVFSSPA
jgi:hypothetical protein